MAQGTSQELDRISGMDPAGPLFCNDVPYPFDKLNVKAAARLGPHDANLVQAIHTDGRARWVFSILPQVRKNYRIGRIFFSNGALQRERERVMGGLEDWRVNPHILSG